jgi:3',5'-cyclic AMP phosphodiesterase CpdA
MPILDNIELVISLTVNVLIIGAWLIRAISRMGKQKSVEKFFGAQNINIFFPSRDLGRELPVIASEDFLAANTLAEFAREHGANPSLSYLPTNSDANFTTGDIVICGPKSNPTIKKLLEVDPYYQFREEENGDWKFIDLSSNNELSSPMDKVQTEQKDIAYMGRLRFHRERKDTFLLIAGIHAIGSYGTAHFISQIRNIRLLNRETEDHCFSTIILTNYQTNPLQIVSNHVFMPIRKH